MNCSDDIPINGLYRLNLGVSAFVIFNPVTKKLMMRIGDWRYEILNLSKYPYVRGGWYVEYITTDDKQVKKSYTGILW